MYKNPCLEGRCSPFHRSPAANPVKIGTSRVTTLYVICEAGANVGYHPAICDYVQMSACANASLAGEMGSASAQLLRSAALRRNTGSFLPCQIVPKLLS